MIGTPRRRRVETKHQAYSRKRVSLDSREFLEDVFRQQNFTKDRELAVQLITYVLHRVKEVIREPKWEESEFDNE